jgi:diacylglycerol kinase family enzyme
VRILLIVNASASSVTARARVIIQHSLGADHDLTVAETSRRGHATRLALGAAADGAEVVAVLGGDGTLNEAANGLAGTTTALGVLPGGSTNVFARTIGMANDPLLATTQLLAALARQPEGHDGIDAQTSAGPGPGPFPGGIRSVSLGNVNGRYFLFHVGFGFDAAVVAEVEKRSFLKRHFGAIVFVGAAIGVWNRYDRRSPWFKVESAGIAPSEGYFAVCLKTSPYTFLGDARLDVAPGTGLDTRLSLLVCEKLTLPTMLSLIASSMTRKTEPVTASPPPDPLPRRRDPGRRWMPWLDAPRARLSRQILEVEVTGYRPVPYQVDGDYLGEIEQLTIRCVPDALRLVVPRQATVPSPSM